MPSNPTQKRGDRRGPVPRVIGGGENAVRRIVARSSLLIVTDNIQPHLRRLACS